MDPFSTVSITPSVTAEAGTLLGGSFSTLNVSSSGDAVSFNVRVNSNGPISIEISASEVANYNSSNSANLDASALSAADVVAMINDQLGMSLATVDGGAIRLMSNFVGGGSSMWVLGFSETTTSGTSGIANGLDGSVNGQTGSSVTFDLAVDGNTAVPITLNAAAVAAYTGPALDPMNLSSAGIAALINQQFGQAVADGSGGSLIFTSPTLGSSSSITVSNFSETLAGGTTGIVDASDTGMATTGTSGRFAINGRTVTLTGGDDTNAVLAKLQSAASGSSGINAFTVNNVSGVMTISGTSGNDVVIAGLTANQVYRPGPERRHDRRHAGERRHAQSAPGRPRRYLQRSAWPDRRTCLRRGLQRSEPSRRRRPRNPPQR